MSEPLRLQGISGEVRGKVWESESLLRAGRLDTFEIVLDESSVSRRHAEVCQEDDKWWIRDLDSTNGTYVNGVRLVRGQRRLHAGDIVQFGKVAMKVEIDDKTQPQSTSPIVPAAAISSSWEDAIQRLGRLAIDRDHRQQPIDRFMAAVMARQHLATCQSEDELLDAVLKNALSILDAEDGAIVMADGPGGGLRMCALASELSNVTRHSAFARQLATMHYRQEAAERCFSRSESLLDEFVPENWARSEGVNPLVGLYVLLRTPRKRLGVLYLDRGGFRPRFREDDLWLADGLAAYLATGIVCANSCTDATPPQGDLQELILNALKPTHEQIAIDPRWLTSAVIDLARAIRTEQAFNRMPILADALMDAGCDSDEIIHHCRQPGHHVRGCWVLDLLLESDSPTPPERTFDR